LINTQFLNDSPLFRDLDAMERAQILMIGHVRNYQAEDVLFREGDEGDGLYIVMAGTIRISKQSLTGEEALAVLEANSFFGEMALIDDSNRAADAIANEKAEVFFIPLKELREVIEAQPPIAIKILYALCAVLAQRLRDTNERYMNIFTIAQWSGGLPGGLIPLP
jgi:CRP-like cAMP-binding protein